MEVNNTTSRRSRKRKPLSDLTNLIPKATATATAVRTRSSTKPPPLSIPKSIINSSTKSSKPDINVSQSDSSIGSSNHINNNNNNPQTNPSNRKPPQPHPSTPPHHSSSTNPPPGTVEDEPLVVYSRIRTAEKTKHKGKKAVDAVPFHSPPLGKDRRKGDFVAFSCPSLEKKKDKGKGLAGDIEVHTNPHPSPQDKSRRKGDSATFSCPPLEKKKDKGKGLAGDIGARTDPHPNLKKKRLCDSLDQDTQIYVLPFGSIEQQRKYFEAVDDFELPEEVVSDEEC